MKKYLLFFLLISGITCCKTPNIDLTGSVRDFDSKNFLQGVTVRVEKKGPQPIC
jgi:hypothetical protein